MDEVLTVELREVVPFVAIMGSTIYFLAELIKAIEIGENPSRGGMGVVLYEMATCELAFEGSASAAIFHAILYGTPKRNGQPRRMVGLRVVLV